MNFRLPIMICFGLILGIISLITLLITLKAHSPQSEITRMAYEPINSTIKNISRDDFAIDYINVLTFLKDSKLKKDSDVNDTIKTCTYDTEKIFNELTDYITKRQPSSNISDSIDSVYNWSSSIIDSIENSNLKNIKVLNFIEATSYEIKNVINQGNIIINNLKLYLLSEESDLLNITIKNDVYQELNNIKLSYPVNELNCNDFKEIFTNNNITIEKAKTYLNVINDTESSDDIKIIESMNLIDLLAVSLNHFNGISKSLKIYFDSIKTNLHITNDIFQTIKNIKDKIYVSNNHNFETDIFLNWLNNTINDINEYDFYCNDGIKTINQHCKFQRKNKICGNISENVDYNDAASYDYYYLSQDIKPLTKESLGKLCDYISKIKIYDDSEDIKYVHKFYIFGDWIYFRYLKIIKCTDLISSEITIIDEYKIDLSLVLEEDPDLTVKRFINLYYRTIIKDS